MQRWKTQIETQLAQPVASGDEEIAVDITALWASSARRRMNWTADYLRPHGYVFHVFDPSPHRATRRFGIAHFRRAS